MRVNDLYEKNRMRDFVVITVKNGVTTPVRRGVLSPSRDADVLCSEVKDWYETNKNITVFI